ncbi:hypothetical protein EMPS_01209 [Entomortierella parvispora]|uniref:Uncharacterized protein n=1 Tax=Entomortierella parvispora TaxID=205924 RepID=A0A9P3H351_9FUNG|nr:hypothetical protein EMPS_01209 [Entomortierella parvispora]
MMFPRRGVTASFVVLCATAFLLAPSNVIAAPEVIASSSATVVVPPATTTTAPVSVIRTTTTTALVPPPTSATLPPISKPPTTTTLPPPIVTTTTTSALPTNTPALNTTCMSTASCQQNQLCAYTPTNVVTGICQDMLQGQTLCVGNPIQPCTQNSDCRSPAFSYCGLDKISNTMVCTGLGIPGTSSACNASSGSSSGDKSSNLTKTLEYAGIGLGCVVVLALSFFLVRWKRNRSRSKMPDFDQIDYGMSNRRRSEPRSSLGAANALSGGARTSEQAYPFSNRPHAGINTAAADDQDVYYDDQYYQDPNMAYSQNMHPMTGMAGGAAMKDPYHNGHDQYDPNSYDQNGYAYDQAYYKETYGDYDQHGNYVGTDAGAGGFYDHSGYGDYGHQPVDHSHVPQAESVVSGESTAVSAPAAAARQPRHRDYAADQYGVEPSELDFGGSGHGSQLAGGASGAPAHGGYGRQY